jgi:hypothetical protein
LQASVILALFKQTIYFIWQILSFIRVQAFYGGFHIIACSISNLLFTSYLNLFPLKRFVVKFWLKTPSLNRRKRLINSYYRNTIAISIEFPLPVFTITFPLLSVPYWYLYLTRLLYPSLRLVFRYLLYFPSSNPETKVLVLVSNPVCNCLMVSIDFSRLIDFVIRLGLFGSFCKAIVVSAIWSLSPPLLPIKSIVASSWLEYP